MREIVKRGRAVIVTEKGLPQDAERPGGMPTVELVAIAGGVKVTRRITFGARNGPRPAVDAAAVAALLEAERQAAAEEAAWQAELAEALEAAVEPEAAEGKGDGQTAA